MANHYFQRTLDNLVHYLTYLQGDFDVGATGAVSNTTGAGITSVTRLGVGTYLIKPDGPYNRFLNSYFTLVPTVTGSSVADGSLVVGTTYQITAVGTTTWHSYGLDAAFTPTAGQTFVATSVGGSGTGTAKAVGKTGIYSVEVADANVQQSVLLGVGVLIQCLNASGTPTDPSNGSKFKFGLMFRNCALKGPGE